MARPAGKCWISLCLKDPSKSSSIQFGGLKRVEGDFELEGRLNSMRDQPHRWVANRRVRCCECRSIAVNFQAFSWSGKGWLPLESVQLSVLKQSARSSMNLWFPPQVLYSSKVPSLDLFYRSFAEWPRLFGFRKARESRKNVNIFRLLISLSRFII